MTHKYDLKVSPLLSMDNVSKDFAIRAAVSEWPFTRIMKDGKDITETLIDPMLIDNKLVVKLEGISELVLLPGQEFPANVGELRG